MTRCPKAYIDMVKIILNQCGTLEIVKFYHAFEFDVVHDGAL